MKYLGMIFLLGLMMSCTTPKVVYDYDAEKDFSIYKSYNYFPQMDSGLSELDLKRLVRQTDSVLQSRGFLKSESPDFYINIMASEFENSRNSAVGVGVGGGGRNVGGGISIGLPVGSKLNQQLTFDFIDVQKDELFWQAVAEGYSKENTTPQERVAYFKAIVLKVFAEYPPKKY